jgi:hypothetical protein
MLRRLCSRGLGAGGTMFGTRWIGTCSGLHAMRGAGFAFMHCGATFMAAARIRACERASRCAEEETERNDEE